MEHSFTENPMLNLVERPAFCVQNNTIVQVNEAAVKKLIQIGTPIEKLLLSDFAIYNGYTGGPLQLTLTVAGKIFQTSVERIDNIDIFLLETDKHQSELQLLALVAMRFRVPLSGVMPLVELLLRNPELCDNPDTVEILSQLNRGLYQIQRMVCDMTDANLYAEQENMHMETLDINCVINEIVEKAKTLLLNSDVVIQHTGLELPTFCIADAQMLERAVFHLISNAVKYSEKPCTIETKLTRQGNMLHFSIQDSGRCISNAVYSQMFSRYLREPGIEDGSFGVGLGMTIVRAVAVAHGGTVLVDSQNGHGNKVTFTISIRQDNTGNLKSDIVRFGDYAGGRDHALLELSDVLPSELYDINKY